jgi:FdhD protein
MTSAAAPRRRVLSVRGDERRVRRDRLAGEEPMEVRVAPVSGPSRPVAVTMRTPGHDFELAAGFLVTEGVIAAGAVRRIAYCDELVDEEQRYNVVTVRADGPIVLSGERPLAATSACGICGKASLDEVEVRCAPLGPGPEVGRATLIGLPETLRLAQRVFDATGGLHAAGLFDPDGRLRVLREDVGRHNAVDKVVGHAVLAGEALADAVLMVSGRAGFEIVQKAAVAGIAVLAAVSAPSSLAVEAAERFGMTLVGFLRGDGFNVYTGRERITGIG